MRACFYYNYKILSSIAWAIRASHHSTLQATPSQIVFGRDMLFNLKSVINWKETSSRKQKQVNLDNIRENRNRIDYDYPRIGQQIYVIRDKIHRKLDGPKKAPFTITD